MFTSSLIEQYFTTQLQLRKLMFQTSTQTNEERRATLLQYYALSFVKEKERVTATELAQHLRLSKSSATQLTQRLVNMKYIKRVQEKNDRRFVHLVLTTSGEEQAVLLHKHIMERRVKIFSKLPEKDIKELIRINTDLIRILEKEDHE